ncbi:hypothetical protein EXIGLDRAFT_717260 [Exidia glandulosa HHB12029]|uniref:Uncharacterized protein n=1 Tax=Exidia glandulosa HHB12029 TaxID=1314781 RepID=A0A166BJN2_EXIGL|nr:hypothetical protein EXIGLDRAFT_717260 [Exidia glandulosa HHB12029]
MANIDDLAREMHLQALDQLGIGLTNAFQQLYPSVAPAAPVAQSAEHVRQVAQSVQRASRPVADVRVGERSAALQARQPAVPNGPPPATVFRHPNGAYGPYGRTASRAAVEATDASARAPAQTISETATESDCSDDEAEEYDGRPLREVAKLIALEHTGPPVGPWSGTPIARRVIDMVKCLGFGADDIVGIKVVPKSFTAEVVTTTYGDEEVATTKLDLKDVTIQVQLA